jgi:hypothetical protein
MSDDNKVVHLPLPKKAEPPSAATWDAALDRHMKEPARLMYAPEPTGDPLRDLVGEWAVLANHFRGRSSSLDVLAAIYSSDHLKTIADLKQPPMPTTIEGSVAALDTVIAEGVIVGEGVAIVRVVAEALRRGVNEPGIAPSGPAAA